MNNLIIVRHGSTSWNEKGRFRGLADIELSELGKRQAAATAERISVWPVAAIYTSPVLRARETADVMGKAVGKEPINLPALTDIDFGLLQGVYFEQAEIEFEDVFHRWKTVPQTVTFPGGESIGIVRERAATAVNKIVEGLSNETIVIVSHFVVINLLVLHFLGLDNSHFRRFEQYPCAVNIFQIQNDKIYHVLLNDTSHLINVTLDGVPKKDEEVKLW